MFKKYEYLYINYKYDGFRCKGHLDNIYSREDLPFNLSYIHDEVSEILKKNATEIKNQIQDKSDENWNKEYESVFATENKYLKSKVNNCSSLEDFQKNIVPVYHVVP